MSEIYTLDELTQSIIDEYKLQMEVDTSFNTYRQQISRTLKKLNIFESSIKKTNTKTNRICHFFTNQHRKIILADRNLYNYVRDNSSDSNIKQSRRYDEVQKNIETRRQAEIERLSDETYEANDDSVPYLSQKELQETANNMMLKALFEKFFTPIDMERLHDDLLSYKFFMDEMDLTPDDLEVEDHLMHPEGHYYFSR